MSFPPSAAGAQGPWWRLLNRYHWFVLVVAALGWLFDCLDQQLFNLARVPAMRELLATPAGPPDAGAVARHAGYATSIFLVGWALGGLVFGVLGDRIGRARTMMVTILMYSVFTGLSAFSTGFWDFAVYRFLTGLGVGGEFAVGVALVAEVMPERARPQALGLLQALSAVGNISAAGISMWFGHLETTGILGGAAGWAAWRWMFVVGALPALLAVVVRLYLREPERWQAARQAATRPLGSYAELFGHPVWRRHALLGMLLACAGVIGLWGIGFFIFDLQRSVFTKTFTAQGVGPDELPGKLTFWTGVTSMIMNVGAFCGILAFSRLTQAIGRRLAFVLSFLLGMTSTAGVFWFFAEIRQLWMIFVMGFCLLAVFGGYAIYFPELFPTRLRSTGVSFCYNVGRLVAALGPAALGLLTSEVFADKPEPMRHAGVAMTGVFLLGLLVLPFLPETKGRPLPEDGPDAAH